MKILGKNIYIGKKYLCSEFTYEIDDINTLSTHEKCHKGIVIGDNALFVKDKSGYFVDIEDIGFIGSLALKVYGAAPRWSKHPDRAGCKYVEVQHYFNGCDLETPFDLKDLISIANSLKHDSSLNNSI
ncbi:MAG: hypothetical protein IKY10_01355 [Clostridia bacterium]|nr:hypothetical protein [Clostridia bacterium]